MKQHQKIHKEKILCPVRKIKYVPTKKYLLIPSLQLGNLMFCGRNVSQNSSKMTAKLNLKTNTELSNVKTNSFIIKVFSGLIRWLSELRRQQQGLTTQVQSSAPTWWKRTNSHKWSWLPNMHHSTYERMITCSYTKLNINLNNPTTTGGWLLE